MKKLLDLNEKIGKNHSFRAVLNTKNNDIIVTAEKVGSSFMDNVCYYNNHLLPFQIIYNTELQKFENLLYPNEVPFTKLTDKQQKVLFENIEKDKLNYIIITRDPYQKMVTGFFQVLKSDNQFQILFDLSDYYQKIPIGTTKKNLLKIRDEMGVGLLNNSYRDILEQILDLSISTFGQVLVKDMHMDLHNQKVFFLINFLIYNEQLQEKSIRVSDISILDKLIVERQFINKEKVSDLNKHQTKLNDPNFDVLQIIKDKSQNGDNENTSLSIFCEYLYNTLQSEYLFYNMLLEKYKLD